MAEFVKVADLAGLKPGNCTAVETGGKTIFLCNVERTVYALDNTCLHRGGPLNEGEVDGAIVTCPWHGWQYDIRTGENCDDQSQKLSTYAVKIEDGAIMVAV